MSNQRIEIDRQSAAYESKPEDREVLERAGRRFAIVKATGAADQVVVEV